MRASSKLLLVLPVLVAFGCASPKVRYVAIDAAATGYVRSAVTPDLEGRPKFKLASSIVTLTAAQRDGETLLKITSIPVEEARNVTYSIVDATSIGVDLNLKLRNKADSMLVESVATQLEDTRIKLVQTIAGILGSVIAKAKGGDAVGVQPSFSASVDLRDYFSEVGVQDNEIALTDADLQKYKSEATQSYTINSLVISAVPADASPRTIYPVANEQRAFPYAACRNATISVTIGGTTFMGSFRVADPNFLQTVALPEKGLLVMQSACGLTATTENVQIATTTEVILEIIKQVRAVADKASEAASK